MSSLKGGVGKTTVTLGLASAAFSRGLRTLVVDLDPQSDVSTGMDVSPEGHSNIADVLESPKEKTVRDAIVPSGWTKHHEGNIDLLIGSPAAINFDGPHPSIREIWKLEEALASVESEYDLVLIDCAPSLNALTRTAWAASDRVLVVTEPGLFAVAAADRALRAIEEIRRGISPRLQPLGIVINRARTQSMEHQFRIRELREMFGPLVLSPQLPERTSLQQAQGAAKPVHIWPGETAQEMAGYFDQILDRILRSAGIDAPTARLLANPSSPATATVVSSEPLPDEVSDTADVVNDAVVDGTVSDDNATIDADADDSVAGTPAASDVTAETAVVEEHTNDDGAAEEHGADDTATQSPEGGTAQKNGFKVQGTRPGTKKKKKSKR